MNFQQIQSQLNDLPSTFTRPGHPYDQLIDAMTAGLFVGAAGDDGTIAEASSFTAAQFGWLDVWGLLFNIPRNNNEPDTAYRARIAYQVTAGAGPPVAIANWLKQVWGLVVTVLEALPAVGYTIQFSTLLTPAQLSTVLLSLAKVRPAGVPFSVLSPSDGLYLNTINFMDGANVTGAYLTGATPIALGIGPATNNTPPSLPTLLLTDPTLNPSLPSA